LAEVYQKALHQGDDTGSLKPKNRVGFQGGVVETVPLPRPRSATEILKNPPTLNFISEKEDKGVVGSGLRPGEYGTTDDNKLVKMEANGSVSVVGSLEDLEDEDDDSDLIDEDPDDFLRELSKQHIEEDDE